MREIYEDTDGVLWIGTFGGGLDALRDGKFYHFRQEDGLLSDNIANVADDGESLWLSTTRGICRIAKAQLWEHAAGKRPHLEPMNYGVDDGLRSAQCSPGYPTGGGYRTSDGRLWFTTSRGLAVYDPHAKRPVPFRRWCRFRRSPPTGTPSICRTPRRLSPGVERIRVRYTAIHLSAPEQVAYSYRLSGLESKWVSAGARREINYNTPQPRQLSFHGEGGTSRRTIDRNVVRLRCAAAILRDDLVPRRWWRRR